MLSESFHFERQLSKELMSSCNEKESLKQLIVFTNLMSFANRNLEEELKLLVNIGH